MNKNNIKSLVAIAAMALSASTITAQTKTPLGGALQHRGLNVLKLTDNHRANNIETARVLKSRAPQAALAPSPFYGRTFYGSLINSSDWATASIASVPYGIYSFEVGDTRIPKPS